MPCGSLDKRRRINRCVPCRKAHARCDGKPNGEPCSFCRTRLLKCHFSLQRPKIMQMIHVTSSPHKAIIQDSWRYTTACFHEALGFLQHFSVLRCEGMLALSHSDRDVSKALSLVGEIYLCRSRGTLEYSEHRGRFQKTAIILRERFSRQLRDHTASWSSALVAGALLFILVDYILDGTIDPCEPWMTDASEYIARTTRFRQELPSFDRDLIRLCQLVDSVNSITRRLYPLGLDFTSGVFKSEHLSREVTHTLGPFLLGKDIDYILSAMWHWSILQRRMVEWAPTANHENPHLSAAERVKGIEIICAVSALQSEMIQIFIDLSSTGSESNYRLLTPYSHWILIGIWQQLQYEKWALLECELPSLRPDHLEQHAVSTLDCIDDMINQAGLCLVIIMPVAFSMAAVLDSQVERQRVLGMLDNQSARCFDVSVANIFRHAFGNSEPE